MLIQQRKIEKVHREQQKILIYKDYCGMLEKLSEFYLRRVITSFFVVSLFSGIYQNVQRIDIYTETCENTIKKI